jgi:acetyl-CoA carboxylase biotin carboxyl carrier protein
MNTKTAKSSKPRGTEKSRNSSRSGLDWAELNRVLDFMSEHGLEEFEYDNSHLHIRLKRPSAAPVMAPAAVMGVPVAPAPVASGVQPGASAPVAAAAAAEDLHTISSPIVGTFYAAANPESAPFVKVGDQVSSGQVLCIIEAMKLMNEIESDIAGEIVKIFPENGHPVEYGEPLFAIRKQ